MVAFEMECSLERLKQVGRMHASGRLPASLQLTQPAADAACRASSAQCRGRHLFAGQHLMRAAECGLCHHCFNPSMFHIVAGPGACA